MITFVDTNVLLDVFLPDPKWGQKSKIRLEQSFNQGSLIINEIIYSELTPQFSSKELLDDFLKPSAFVSSLWILRRHTIQDVYGRIIERQAADATVSWLIF